MIIFSSSSLFAAEAASPGKPPLSILEISSTATRQTTPEVSYEPRVKEKYKYYDIGGSSMSDLQKQINQNGTRWHDGKSYAAVTSWDIHYGYDVLNADGKCSVISVKTMCPSCTICHAGSPPRGPGADQDMG